MEISFSEMVDFIYKHSLEQINSKLDELEDKERELLKTSQQEHNLHNIRQEIARAELQLAYLDKEMIREVLELEEDYLYSKGLIEYNKEVEEMYDDFDDYDLYDDTEICSSCGDIYCSCCGCDCYLEDLED